MGDFKDERMRAMMFPCILLLLAGCHSPSTQPGIPLADQPVEPTRLPDYTTGPTNMAKVADGYELTNRLFRVVISEQTGDVIFWGSTDKNRNMLGIRGIFTALTGLPPSTPRGGYIQKRDDNTWEFYGEDDNHIIWRKIYCLDGDSLLVSIQIQNNRPDPLVAVEQLNGDLPGLHITHHDPELLQGFIDHTAISLRGYNEFPAPASQPAMPTLICSDTFHLKPQERQSYTSQWKLSP
jgi:hypothetical protein